MTQKKFQNGKSRDKITLAELKEIKKCWNCENKPNFYFSIKLEQNSKAFTHPTKESKRIGICEADLANFKADEGKCQVPKGFEKSEWTRYNIYREIKLMNEQELEQEREEVKALIIKRLDFHGFLGVNSRDGKLIQHGILRRLARKMKQANWDLGNNQEIEAWLIKASKGKFTDELLANFKEKARRFRELKGETDGEGEGGGNSSDPVAQQREWNRKNAKVNKSKPLIEGKTYEEWQELLNYKGGNYEDYGSKEEAKKAWAAQIEWSKARDYKYWPWSYNQWNNVTYYCNRCGILTENGTGYSQERTIEEFEQHCEESEAKYSNYQNGEKAAWYMYCPVDSVLKGYSEAYETPEAFYHFDGGRNNTCGTTNRDGGSDCLSQQAWEAWKKATEDDPRRDPDRAEGLYDYQAFRVFFDEWAKDKTDNCPEIEDREHEKWRAEMAEERKAKGQA